MQYDNPLSKFADCSETDRFEQKLVPNEFASEGTIDMPKREINFEITPPMLSNFFDFIKKSFIVQKLNPETAKDLTLRLLFLMPSVKLPTIVETIFEQKIAGLNFIHPVGVAAGYDKDAISGLNIFRLGFSFAEYGTVTPLAQAGNARPRIFRLPEDKAIINRMGFNNAGMDAVSKNLQKIHAIKKPHHLIGVNIGKNTTGEIDDYLTCFQKFSNVADYITINISSPNTPNLRDLQKPDMIQKLIGQCKNHAEKHNINIPIFLKLAPDLDKEHVNDLAKAVLAGKNEGIDGLILTNTTIERPDHLRNIHKNETGGLSGKPLFESSTEILKQFARITENKIPLIGVGGISNGYQAYQKIRAGACLLQLYTGLIYESNYFTCHILTDMARYLKEDGFSHISEAIGVDL